MPRIYGDRWEVRKDLKEGGQARTYIVKDRTTSNDAQFVLKRLKNRTRLDRFRRECDAIAKLSHPNVITLLDVDLDCEKPYLVMEYCAGGTIADADAEWFSQPSVAFELFDQMCAAVSHAHASGVIHRDLKPANILLRSDTGPAVVSDFGLCLVEWTNDRLTKADEAVGPRLFMAPELEDGWLDDVRPECDVYSLGKLLYWMLAGGRVFSREKHRERKWDLKKRDNDSILGYKNIYLEHVNRLLDLMITASPSDRRDMENILVIARQHSRLVVKEFPPVSGSIRQPCPFCGKGYYALRASDQNQLHNFMGMQPIGSTHWRVFSCTNCGNVQMFRIDKASEGHLWNKTD